MAANVSVIGRTTRARGRVTGTGNLEVQGFVEGDVAVDGDVTVEAHGMVGASVHGKRLIIRGAVKGDLVGEEAVSLEDGARVVGDVRAPRVAIAPGALVRGFVQTGDADGAPARASRAQATGRPQSAPHQTPTVPARPAPPAATRARAATAPPEARAASPKPPTKHSSSATNASNDIGANASLRRPPPPIVPALKKAKGQIAKRKER